MKFSEDFYKKVIDASHDEICVTDNKGILIYCNKAFEKNYGMKKEDMLGKNVLYLPENGYSTIGPVPQVLKTKKACSMEQFTNAGKQLILTATPIFDKSGEIEYIVENTRDITELNQIKNKLEDTQNEVKKYKNEIENIYRTTLKIETDIILTGSVMRPIINTVTQISKTDVIVLLLGESGTGKSSLARYIHKHSRRDDKPFITINCATISAELLESELFGYAPGAFTGASSKGKAGLVELANGGTLFFDEIAEIPQSLQAKFLQLIQEKTFIPVGGMKEKKVDIRIISATNCDLLKKVEEKTFREDLYYRLNVIELKIPPLRERRENLLELIKHYFEKYCREFNMNKIITKEAVKLISYYSFPGNIRELQNIIQKIILTSPTHVITEKNIPKNIFNYNSEFNMEDNDDLASDQDFDTLMESYEKDIISKVYNHYKSSYKVADHLNISQSKASRLIRKYNL
ncbi:MAG: sigma 54-interacting transcriptional regulator [Terrisporobacter sp.]|uniref:sigma-54 interaction domain-containing protein n=1 Tax=Terrisporobacter sp. TaxID=1965305 RepID=UPI002FC8493F